MHSKEDLLEKCKIQKISEINKEQLSTFYKKKFPERYKSLTENWRWWYRSEPLVLTLNNVMIGQAAYLPTELLIADKKIQAIWFQDYAVLPAFKGMGLGKLLSKEWMKICPNQMAICTPYSLRVLKKLGWSDNYDTKRRARPINFSKFLPIIKNLNASFINAPLKYLLKIKYRADQAIKPYQVSTNYKVIEESFDLRKDLDNEEFVKVNRDKQWLHWRLIECPYKKDIYFFKYNNNFAIAHICSIKKFKRINILYTYYTDQPEEYKLFVLITKWALENNIDFIWLVNKSKNLEYIFPGIYNKQLSFASWSSDKENFDTLKKGFTDLQGIDSDIESALFVE